GVVDRVVGVLVRGPVDGRVQLVATDQVTLVRGAIVADERDVVGRTALGPLALLLLGGDDAVLRHAPVDVDTFQVGDRGQRGRGILHRRVRSPIFGLVRLDLQVGVFLADDVLAAGGAVPGVQRGQVALNHRDRARAIGV